MSDQERTPDWKDTQGQVSPADAVHGPPGVRRARTPGASWTTHPLTLLLGVVVVVTLMWVVGASVVRWRARVEAERLMQITQEAARQSQLQAQQRQREAAEREEQRQVKLQRQEALRMQADAQRQQAEEDARRAEAAAADRKEKAWARFYRKPAYCETAATLECANGYIRARRSFELKWNQGEF